MFIEKDILANGNMGESNLVSETIDLGGVSTFKIVAIWTDLSGSPIGELSIERYNDSTKSFETILESNQSITDSDGNFHIWDFPYNPFALIRARYVRTQGSGTMRIFAQYGGE